MKVNRMQNGSFNYNSHDIAGNTLKYANKLGFAVLGKDGKVHLGDQPHDKKRQIRDLSMLENIFDHIPLTAFPEVTSANGARKKVLEVYGPAKKMSARKPSKRSAGAKNQPQVRVAGKKPKVLKINRIKPYVKHEYYKAEFDRLVDVYEALLWLSEKGKSPHARALVSKVMGK